MRQAWPTNAAVKAKSATYSRDWSPQFSIAGAVLDKRRLYLADQHTDFYLAGLSAILTPICEYLLSLEPKGRLAVYVPQAHQVPLAYQEPIRRAFDQLRSHGDAARQAQFFKTSLLTLHSEDVQRWPGLKLAQAYAPLVVRAILGERVAELRLVEAPDSSRVPPLEERWLTSPLIGSLFGQVLIE